MLVLSPLTVLGEDTPAPAAVQQENSQLRTAKQANLRKLPNTKSDKLETLKKHSIVTILSEMDVGDETWVYVRVAKSGREGYVLLSLLEPVPTPTPEPTATPTPTPSPEPTATPEADSEAKDDETPAPNAVSGETLYDEPRLVRTLKRANLRKKPDGSRLGVVAADTALNAIGEVERDGELWLHIEKGKDNKEGYILAELLRQVRPVKLLPVAEGEVREMFP